MKNLIYILIFLFSNISLSQSQSLYEHSWRLDKFIINGEDITYTDQNNYIHYLSFQNSGEEEATIVSNFHYCYYGMYSTINNTQFTVLAAYDDSGCIPLLNEADAFMESIGAVFYGQSQLFNYVVNDLGTSKQLIVTNESNNIAIYNSVNLSNQNPDKVKDLVIYPNPTQNRIYLPKILDGKDFTIYSLDGRLIKTSKILDSSIDISELSIGTYILKYELDDKIIKKKIIKN